jgi:hypothetical protein
MQTDPRTNVSTRDSAAEAVTILFRFASLAVHPDRPGGDTTTMQRVVAAAELLRKGPAPIQGQCALRPNEADRVMPWGKHRGLPMGQLPLGYLGWMASDNDDPAVRRAALDVLHWRVAVALP